MKTFSLAIMASVAINASRRLLGLCRLAPASHARTSTPVQLLKQCHRNASTDARIVRFVAEDGNEYFGTFTDVTEAHCKVAKKNEATGKMQLSEDVKAVDVILPPVDPPAVYCIGLNYVDHAAEVKMEMPKYPVVFMKPVTALTGHNSAIVIPKVASDPPEVRLEA